jgi:hypothetical protein
MSKYLLIAINGPTTGEGDEQSYNDWYNQTHLADLQKVRGNLATRRFRVVWQNRIEKPYIAISEFEADDPAALMKELGEKASDFADSRMDRTTSISLLAVELDTNQ